MEAAVRTSGLRKEFRGTVALQGLDLVVRRSPAVAAPAALAVAAYVTSCGSSRAACSSRGPRCRPSTVATSRLPADLTHPHRR